MSTGERVLIRRMSRDQVALRGAVAVLPVLSTWSSIVIGSAPQWWLLVLVGCLSGWWATRPESAVGVVSLVAPSLWWAFAAGEPSWWFAVPGCLLCAAHLAATVSAFGPAEAVISSGTRRLWARRWVGLCGACLIVATGVMAAALVDAAVLRSLWPWAVLAVLIVGALGLAGLATKAD